MIKPKIQRCQTHRLAHLKGAILVCSCLLLLAVLVAANGHAQDAGFSDREYLKIDADISSTIDVVKTGSNPYIQYVTADLFFHPITDERLEILSINTTPSSETQGAKLRFTWLSPKDPHLTFAVSSVLKSKSVETVVVSKIPYPLSFVPPETLPFLAETPTADFNNPEIQAISSNLSKDEDDLFVLSAKVAAWVRNAISYNLSTVTAKASKPASWVLEKRQGVCDELTNLFIAIMRAQGIPARFISGLAYTDSPSFPEKWGGHGWAEVFFPGYGWVPFDPTYGQFGWLDSSHIKLKEGADATEASTDFEWRGQNINMGIHPLKMSADIVETGPPIQTPFSLRIRPVREAVRIGSYNVIIAAVTNKDNRYHALDISLGSTDGLTAVEPARKDVVLKPFEKQNIAWIVHAKETLNPEYLYTFPIVVYSQRNLNATSSFNASIREPVLSEEDANLMAEVESAGIRTNAALSCKPGISTPHQGQPFEIICTITYPAGTQPEPALLCAEGHCVKTADSEHRISVTKETPGRGETLVTLIYKDVPIYTSVSYIVLDEPMMKIRNASAPLYVGYDDAFNLTISISQQSLAKPLNTQLTASLPGLSKSWPVPPAPESIFTIQMKGADIAGNPGINVTLRYENEQGAVREDHQVVEVYISDISAWQSLRMAFARFSLWIHDLSSN